MKQTNSNLQNPAEISEFLNLSEQCRNIKDQISALITDEKTIIVFLLGSQNSGKTTFFYYLNQEKLNILEKRKVMPLSNKSQWFSFFQVKLSRPHLFLDFDVTFISEKHKNNLIFDELFLSLIEKYEIKMIYILEHKENSLFQRGSQLQEFIRKYLVGENENIKRLIIILNKYQRDLNDEDLISKVQQQLSEIYKTSESKIFVFRQITTIQEQQNEFSIQKKNRIYNSIIELTPLQIQKDSFPLNQKFVYQLGDIFKKTITSLLQNIQEKMKNGNILKQEDLKKLKEQYQSILHDSQITNPNILYHNSSGWVALVNDTISIKSSEFQNYTCVWKVLHQFEKIIVQSKILVQMNNTIQNSCQVLMQNVETYIKQDIDYNNTTPKTINIQTNSDSIEENIQKYKTLYKIQFEELCSIVNRVFENQPCENTRSFVIIIDTLKEYNSLLEELKREKKKVKKSPNKTTVQNNKESQLGYKDRFLQWCSSHQQK